MKMKPEGFDPRSFGNIERDKKFANAKLPVSFATWDDVPIKFKELGIYKQFDDGRYWLDIDIGDENDPQWRMYPETRDAAVALDHMTAQAKYLNSEIEKLNGRVVLSEQLPADWTPEYIEKLRKLRAEGYGLTKEEYLAQLEAEYQAECARLDAEQKTMMEKYDREIATMNRQIETLSIRKALHDAMESNGIRKGFEPAVFAVHEGMASYSKSTGVLIATEHGAMSPENFYAWWTASPEGLPFVDPKHVPARPELREFAPDEDSYLAMVAKMR